MTIHVSFSRAFSHLVLDGLPVLWIGYDRQLKLRHLLHLSIHVDFLQQTADLSSEQEHSVFLAVALSEQRRAGRVDSSNPVLQIRLTRGLKRAHRRTSLEKIDIIMNLWYGFMSPTSPFPLRTQVIIRFLNNFYLFQKSWAPKKIHPKNQGGTLFTNSNI